MINDINELQQRIAELAGHSLGSLAAALGLTLPKHLHHHKGWLGNMLELALGADAGNQSLPDFTQLGIELKTVPVNAQGKPLESTYVCTVPLQNLGSLTYENSVICAKLSHVLWIPISAIPGVPLSDRQILKPQLWRPSPNQYQVLKADFDELMDLIAMGEISQITASLGTALHIRPKAADARALTQAISQQGHHEPTLPRGFYLRPQFTQDILRIAF